MKILSRKSTPAKVTPGHEGSDGRTRRVEITVEREIVSVLVRGRQSAPEPAWTGLAPAVTLASRRRD